jgi:hypothetical protein
MDSSRPLCTLRHTGAVATPRDRNRRLARRGLHILLRRVIELIPILGPSLAIGAEILDAVREELADERQITREDLIRLLNMLDQEEVDEEVDESLASDSGIEAISGLDQRQVLQVRRRLSHLPSELAEGVNYAKEQERRDKRARRQRQLAESEERHRQLVERRRDLDARLTSQMKANQWKPAYRTVRKRIQLGGVTREHRKAERILYRRANPLGGLFALLVLGILASFPILVLGQDMPLPDTLLTVAVSLTPLFALMLPLSSAAIASRLGTTGRGLLAALAFCWVVVLFLQAAEVLPQIQR